MKTSSNFQKFFYLKSNRFNFFSHSNWF